MYNRLIEKKTFFGFKLETTPGVMESLASTNFNQLAYDLNWQIVSSNYQVDALSGNYSNFKNVMGKLAIQVNFSIDLYSLSNSNITSPAYYDLLQACGWKKTVYENGVSIAQNSDSNNTSGTLFIVANQESNDGTYNQLIFKISGAMGKVKFSCLIGKPIKAEFEFIGSLFDVMTTLYGDEYSIFNNINPNGVSGSPANPTEFTINTSHLLTYITDYHWNNNLGSTPPGTILIRHTDGTQYGPFQCTGRMAYNTITHDFTVPNGWWDCYPNVVIKAGTYTIVDSDNSTWSNNSTSGYKGFSEVKGSPPITRLHSNTEQILIPNLDGILQS